jgi:hypothetical protein
MTDNVNNIRIPENLNLRAKESESENKMIECETNTGLAMHRYFSDQR